MDSTKTGSEGRFATSGRLTSGLPEVAAGDTLAGRFLIREVLGIGATGTVFSALDSEVGQKVAVKLLHAELDDERTRERLRREVRAARSFHPNLVAIYDLHQANGHVFLSMELVEGRSLKDLLRRQERLDPDEVVAIAKEITSALAHLHARGLVHRDIKPGNILLSDDGAAKLCDLGLARPLEEGMTVTETETVVGTPAYMAPEQGLGAELTAASDIYGLGVTLYQSLTGTVPLTSDNAVATLTRRQRERPPSVRRDRAECPVWLNRLIRQMLEPKPIDRPSAARVARALETARVWPRPRKRSLIAAAAGALVVAAVAFAGWTSLIHPTVGIDHDQLSVFGLDADGNTTWTRSLPAPPESIERADLDADGNDDIVVTGPPKPEGHERPPADRKSYAMILNTRGEVVSSVVLEDVIGTWPYPYRKNVFPIVSFDDLDGDGWTEVIVNCRHQEFYPAALLVFWPRWAVWDMLLHHPGSVIAVGSARESGRPGLRFVAYNNLLGMTKVYGEIELVPPESRPESYGRPTWLKTPPDLMSRHSTIGSWRTYVPFADGSATPYRDERFVIEHRPALVIGLAERGPTFDEFFNPLGGPNRGCDLREARLCFAESLSLIGAHSRAITVDGAETLIENIREDAGPLMDEIPYEIIVSTLGAKALAGVGGLDEGIAMLERTRDLKRDDDLLFRLAHLYALRGDLSAAQVVLRDTVDHGTSSRAGFDVPLLMLQIAIEQHDQTGISDAIACLTERARSPETTTGLRNSLNARARLWWDSSTPIDAQVRTTDTDGDGDAIASLTRWRLGLTASDEVERMRSSIDLNPDSFKLGTVALAAALTSRGRSEEALTELDRLIAAISHSAKWDFTDAEVLKLAKAVRVVALEASGDPAGAAAAGHSLERELDSDLLPGILVGELLHRIEG